MIKKRLLSYVDQRATSNLRQIWDKKKRQLGLTQSAAAERLGFSNQSAVSQYLNGDIIIGTDATLKFASLLKVSPSDIRPELEEYLSHQAAAKLHTVEQPRGIYQTRYYTVPLLSYPQVNDYLNNKLTQESLNDVNYYPIIPNTNWGTRVFCIRYTSDAMQPVISANDWLYIDPDQQANPQLPSVWDFADNGVPTVGLMTSHVMDNYLRFSNQSYPSTKIPTEAMYWGAVVAKIGLF